MLCNSGNDSCPHNPFIVNYLKVSLLMGTKSFAFVKIKGTNFSDLAKILNLLHILITGATSY